MRIYGTSLNVSLPRFPFTFIEVIIMLTLVGIVGTVIWTGVKHPCVRYETQPCEVSTCTSYSFSSNNSPSVCREWTKKMTTCETCVEYK